jgi:hypothetical protein
VVCLYVLANAAKKGEMGVKLNLKEFLALAQLQANAELRLIPLNGVVVAPRRNCAGRFLTDLSEQLGRRGSSRTVPEAFDYDDAGGNVRLVKNQNRRLHQHAILAGLTFRALEVPRRPFPALRHRRECNARSSPSNRGRQAP